MLKWSGALAWQPSPKAKDWMPPTTNGRNMAVGKLALAVTEETSHVGPSELPLGTLPPTHPSKAPGAQGMAVCVIPPLDSDTGPLMRRPASTRTWSWPSRRRKPARPTASSR